jgi:hypothetical protein
MRPVKAALLCVLLVACSPASTRVPMHPPPVPRITSVSAPTPIVYGTILRIHGLDLDRVGPVAELVVRASGSEWILAEVSTASDGTDARPFLTTAALLSGLGDGAHSVELVVRGDEGNSEAYAATLTTTSSLALRLDAAPGGTAHFEDLAVLHGAGFTTATEGAVVAHVIGVFTPTAGGPLAVDAMIPVELADLAARDRAVLALSTDLAGPTGLSAGHLHGTLALESTLTDGQTRRTPPTALDLDLAAPELFALDPSTASIGRIVAVRGAGFLGRPGRSNETTLLRIAATFTPEGGSASPFSMELVPTWTSGAEVGLVLDAHVESGALVSQLFHAQRGVLAGTATPIALRGTAELAGSPTPFSLTLGAPRQVVQLRFLPGWYDSLTRLGLAAAQSQVIDGIVRRIESIYAGHAVDVRTTAPTDYAPNAYAIVEIGGPDPNGSGLFGYDNSAGKDVGNLRLFDRLGGANAETQADGFPGYGGVFVESMLWWSAHPELESPRPTGAPDPEPLFDEIFDPVRAEPATYDEAMGVGGTDRVALVAHAIRALANLVGETTAHELGHSLGLAQPFGDPTAFHDVGDGDGCLMDSGYARPLGERMAEPGFSPSHFCYEEPAYLTEILAAD